MSEFFNGVMRAISSLIGRAMLLMGGVWILQGFNIAFLDSFMANDKQWALWGAILALVGAAQIFWSNTREAYYKEK
jgi:drug/metabolite transporter superfamily protein YnfA